MIDKEFKRQFDAFENIEKAKSLANDLGYDEAYCDGIRITSPTYSEEMRKKISYLCGNTKWPKSVMDAYSEGLEEGHWES